MNSHLTDQRDRPVSAFVAVVVGVGWSLRRFGRGRAIALGLPPIQAIQAATLNPATYSGLEQEIGGIAPGRWADIVLIEDLEQCRVGQVLVKGKTVAREGKSVVDERAPMTLPEDMFSCLTVGPTISAEQLVNASPSPAPRYRR